MDRVGVDEAWLQLLKEIAPAVTRPAMLVNPNTQPDRGVIFLTPFDGAARSLGLKSIKGEVHDLETIETSMAGLAKEPGGGVGRPEELSSIKPEHGQIPLSRPRRNARFR
jgi:hypothetical protein